MQEVKGGLTMKDTSARRPAFSPSRAFVVQFRDETQIEAGHMAGRVEHVISGQASHFESLDALLAFLERVLMQVRETSAPEDSYRVC
jgi:hypothetical protein